MKKLIPIFLCFTLLCGCYNPAPSAETTAPAESAQAEYPAVSHPVYEEIPFVSRFDQQTEILLSDSGITVDGGSETDAVFTSHDIIYYEDKDTYGSGNPYGEGTDADKHTPQEAAAHTVVNITQPGAYRVSGTLSSGQIRIDLGEDAYFDETAVVELILENASITCTVAPAVLFLNVYECDGQWSTDTASSDIDTSAAGANLILEGKNTVSGAYVARIYKDQAGEKKLWKQDGALYSYMSMNVYGPGTLDLTAENEGLDTELHLTLNGGNINIRSGNDGINTNEDGVSVTTINAGNLHIIAGLGEEGDGIDSNGYLVINGGVVIAAANPAADAGLDSDMGSFIHGGTVVAFGSTMDWAESDSKQVTMNLQFSQQQSSGASLVLAYPDNTPVFAYDPGQDEILGENIRQYMGAIVSSPNLRVGQSYQLFLGSSISGTESGGLYTAITGFTGGSQMAYTGTDVGMGGFDPENLPEDFDPDNMELPEGFEPGGREIPGEVAPGSMERPQPGNRQEMPGDMTPPELPEGETMPSDRMPPEGMEWPEGETIPEGMERPNGGTFSPEGGESNTLFYLTDQVNAFSGIAPNTNH